ATLPQPIGDGLRNSCNLVGRTAIRPVPDDRIGVGDGGVGDRRAVDRNADFQQISCNQSRAKTGSRKRAVGVLVVELPKGRSWRIKRPMGWAQALHPAAFLIDENRSIAAPDRIAKALDEAANLVRALDIAGKKD